MISVVCTCCYKTFITVISEPDDVMVCEGRSTTFICALNKNIRSDHVQWYRLMKDRNVTEEVK